MLRAFVAIVALALLSATPSRAAAPEKPRVVHVFVALADNAHQGIVPVPARLGNGDDAAANLYWGAAFGVKTYFRSSADWKLAADIENPTNEILERCVFVHRGGDVYLVADAYRGRNIREAVTDFLNAAAGRNETELPVKNGESDASIAIGGGADLVAYVGHDAFMDFQISPPVPKLKVPPRPAIVLACASKQYFGAYLKDANAEPLLWTTNLMAPEAYTLKAAVDGWIAGESGARIRDRAAAAYDKYQHCGLHAAQKLFATGW